MGEATLPGTSAMSYSVHPMDAFISQPVVSGSAQGGPPNGRQVQGVHGWHGTASTREHGQVNANFIVDVRVQQAKVDQRSRSVLVGRDGHRVAVEDRPKQFRACGSSASMLTSDQRPSSTLLTPPPQPMVGDVHSETNGAARRTSSMNQ